MAKLDVKVFDGDVIEYEGELFEKIDMQAQVGDIVFNKRETPTGNQAKHEYYEVGKIDSYTRVYDDNGNLHGWNNEKHGEYFDVYRKETGALPEGTKVRAHFDGGNYTISHRRPEFDDSAGHSGKAYEMKEGGWAAESQFEVVAVVTKQADVKPGDKIRITNADEITGGEYENGSVLTVRKTNGGGDVYAEGVDIIILDNEFEVISEAPQEETYEDAFPVGAKVKLVLPEGRFSPKYGFGAVSEGDVGEVVGYRKSTLGDHVVVVNFPAHSQWRADPSELVKVTDELKIGDYAKIKEDAATLYMEEGDVVKISRGSLAYDFMTARVSDGIEEPFDAEDLEKTDKPAGKGSKVKKGDTVKIVADTSGRSNHRDLAGWHRRGQGLMEFGATGEVIIVLDEGVEVKFDEEQPGIPEAGHRECFLLADGEYEVLEEVVEEVVEATIEVGDKVRILVDECGARVGEIVEVTEVPDIRGNLYYKHEKATPYSFVARLNNVELVEKASEVAEEIEVGDIVLSEGELREVRGVKEPGYLCADEGLTLRGGGWRFIKNCTLVAKKSDRKDV